MTNRLSNIFHPASWLLFWVSFVVLLQTLAVSGLLIVFFSSLLLALLFARQRVSRLIWRARWLLLSLAVLFIFFTPGEFLPGAAGKLGMTVEGGLQAAQQLSRMGAILASLAILHEAVGQRGLLAGLYCLLQGFSWRDKTVVRLMLVLETVEQQEELSWRGFLQQMEKAELAGNAAAATSGAERLEFAVASLQWQDKLLMPLLLLFSLLWLW